MCGPVVGLRPRNAPAPPVNFLCILHFGAWDVLPSAIVKGVVGGTIKTNGIRKILYLLKACSGWQLSMSSATVVQLARFQIVGTLSSHVPPHTRNS